MSATASYDGRVFAAALEEANRRIVGPERAAPAVSYDPEAPTELLEVLDDEDRAISRLARERFEAAILPEAHEPIWGMRKVRVHYHAVASLERHPNTTRKP